MNEIMSDKAFHGKYVYGVAFLYYTYFNFTQAAFPLERDVTELVGVSQHKHWIVFMDKRARFCLSETKSKALSSLIDVFGCVFKPNKNRFPMKHMGRYCCLTQKYPNVLQYVNKFGSYRSYRNSIQIILHQKFSLNVTVVHSFLRYSTGSRYGLTSFTIAGKSFPWRQYPTTFMLPNNTAEVVIFELHTNHVLIEYSVAQNFSAKNLHLRRSEAMPFSWGYFVIRIFHLRVDARARLVFDVISRVRCKLIVYDGPSERLPIIMKLNDTCISQKVMASTFQVFVVMVDDLQQEHTVNYFPTYIKTASFNLTNDGYRKISFDNHTNCSGHSLSARLCIYTFHTYNLRKIYFSLRTLRFTGSYQVKQFSSGIIIYNHDHGITGKVSELEGYTW